MTGLYRLLASFPRVWLLVLGIGLLSAGCAKNEAESPVDCGSPTLTITSAISFTQRNQTTVTGTLTCSTPPPPGAPVPYATVIVTFPDGTTATVMTNAAGIFGVTQTGKTYSPTDTVTAFSRTGRTTATKAITVQP
jgi:hypothetical protein